MLTGKTALITGAGSGIGRRIAICMAGQNARVFLVGRRKEALEETVRLCGSGKGEAAYMPCDISREEDVKAAVAEAVHIFGTIDTVVNNAALFLETDILKPHLEDSWMKMLDVNVMGIIRVIHEAIPYLIRHEKSSVINLSSIDAFSGCKGYAGYSAAKGAVVSLTRGLAVDLGVYGVRVNAIAPGITKTPMTQARIKADRDNYIARTLLKRIGTDKDIADAALFLASDMADYITGEVLQVNGGMQMI
ncbi:SDR family oxidoreductase [Enterocloster sp. OA13]|uniref:SDR family NAD(P)-dependent oxidoreductase n=1 Tax=Enterocloster TaxID=2719313 RepID=UPI000470B251|nr:SDR family oxidoreductase [Lachnoclostridium pacaense]MCC2879524.1 SDR family oxidoreductase [Lachnoclostridium pacaense]MCH1952343.1 SDR family oxidoreductase [Enterocloster sp. OA13]